jgi:hypothetical protein
MMAKKVSDLVDVEEKGIPLLYSAGESEVLHIVRREGKSARKRSGSIGGYPTRYDITDCNRLIEWGSVYTGGVASEWHGRLCSKCGTPEQFQEVLREYHRTRKESYDAYEARQAAERLERERVWNLAREAAEKLAVELLAVDGLTEIDQDSYRITAVFEIDGRRHPVVIYVLAAG